VFGRRIVVLAGKIDGGLAIFFAFGHTIPTFSFTVSVDVSGWHFFHGFILPSLSLWRSAKLHAACCARILSYPSLPGRYRHRSVPSARLAAARRVGRCTAAGIHVTSAGVDHITAAAVVGLVGDLFFVLRLVDIFYFFIFIHCMPPMVVFMALSSWRHGRRFVERGDTHCAGNDTQIEYNCRAGDDGSHPFRQFRAFIELIAHLKLIKILRLSKFSSAGIKKLRGRAKTCPGRIRCGGRAGTRRGQHHRWNACCGCQQGQGESLFTNADVKGVGL
jgi:hypothetical protein